VKMGATVEPEYRPIPTDEGPLGTLTGSPFTALPNMPKTAFRSDALPEFLGLLFTHGGVCIEGEFAPRFFVASVYPEIAKRLGELCRELFDVEVVRDDTDTLSVARHDDEALVKWLWETSPGKAVPRCILQSSSALQRVFLSAAFYEARLNVIRLKSSSATVRNLPVSALRVLQTMLLRIGVPSLLRTEENPSLSVDKKYVQPETGEFWPDVRPWLLTRVSRVERLRGPVVGVEAPTTGLLIANGFPWGDK